MRLGVTALLLVALTTGCNVGALFQPATPTPVPTRPLAPTFTPTPQALQPLVVVTPPKDGTPGVIIIQPTVEADRVVIAIPPTDTPTPPPTDTPAPTLTLPPEVATATAQVLLLTPGVVTPGAVTPGAVTPGVETLPSTPTPLPTDTPTPAPTATAFVVVESGYVALRTGPGLDYPLLAQLGPNIPIAVIGRNTQGNWFEICCVNGLSVWVPATHVRVFNDTGQAPLVVPQPPPPPTPTFTPTFTPTLTPTPTATPYPFERAIGPQFFPTDNGFLTIWVKLFIGTPPLDDAAPGYYLDVKFEGFDRPPTNGVQSSYDHFEWSAPAGAGNRVQYNLKYEYKPPDPKSLDPNSTQTRLDLVGTGTWTIFVKDGAGNQLSDAVTFTTAPSNPNREIYVGWQRVR